MRLEGGGEDVLDKFGVEIEIFFQVKCRSLFEFVLFNVLSVLLCDVECEEDFGVSDSNCFEFKKFVEFCVNEIEMNKDDEKLKGMFGSLLSF